MSVSEDDTLALPPGVPPEAATFLQQMGYLQPDRLQVGAAAPHLVLNRLRAEGTVEIGAPNALLPTVLIFGSYT